MSSQLEEEAVLYIKGLSKQDSVKFPWLKLMLKLVVVGAVIFVAHFARIGYLNSEERKFDPVVVGKIYPLSTLICDTAEQVIEVHAINDNEGLEAAQRKVASLNKGKIVFLCVVTSADVSFVEEVAQFRLKNGVILHIVMVVVVYSDGTFYPSPQFVAIFNPVITAEEQEQLSRGI